MKDFEKKMRKKGWKEKEIEKTMKIINKYKTPELVLKHDKRIYWYGLIIIILTIMIASVILIPFLLTIYEPAIYIFVVFIGLTFGYIFRWIIGEIEVVQIKKHILLLMVIPVFSILIFFFTVGYANYLQGVLKLENSQNNILIGVIYSISFLMPYFIYESIKIKRR